MHINIYHASRLAYFSVSHSIYDLMDTSKLQKNASVRNKLYYSYQQKTYQVPCTLFCDKDKFVTFPQQQYCVLHLRTFLYKNCRLQN